MKYFIVVCAALAFGLIACDETEESDSAVVDFPVVPHQILRAQDYSALTGCEVSAHYESSLRTALDYLVFDEGEDKEDLAYVQRETIPLFRSLIQSGTNNLVDAACLPDSLRRIGEELDLLVSINKTEFDNSGTDGFGPLVKPVRFDPDAGGFPVEEGLTYSLQSRSEYMNSTQCLVSPATYEKFHAAFDFFLFDIGHPEDAPLQMVAFLSDVRDSRPLPDGSLNPQCLTPGLLKLGQEMGVLTDEGKIITQDN